MATDKPNVRTYLDPRTYEKLEAYKEANNIKSLSAAIDIIVSQFLGTGSTLHLPASDIPQSTELQSEVADLKEQVTRLVADYASVRDELGKWVA